MIFLKNISVFFGDRVLFDDLTLTIAERQSIGLVGRNGTGKTTLFKIINREMSPTQGEVSYSNSVEIGYLSQVLPEASHRSILSECLQAFPRLETLRNERDRVQALLEQGPSDEEAIALSTELSNVYDELNSIHEHEIEAEAHRILLGLGFRPDQLDQSLNTLSGGWQMRVQMAKLLLKQPPLLLLDEPTNHLDIESILWLENYLQTYSGGYIVISHDRDFLNNTSKSIWDLTQYTIHEYKGNYDSFLIQREERKALLESAFKNQQKVIADKERTIKRFMAKATKTSMAQSMQKQLDKMDRIELVPEDEAVFNIRFNPAPRSGEKVIEAIGISKSYGSKQVLNHIHFELLRNERVAFVGQNGQGKTTLVKIMIDHLAKDRGEVKLGHQVFPAYYAQNQADQLDGDLTLLETMEAKSPAEMRTQLRNILGAFLFSGEDVDKKVKVLSGGEKARLALACLLLNPINLLVLDEPTNHLDLQSKDLLKKALQAYDGALLVVSHDRDFLAGLTHKVIEFRDHKIYEHLGDVNEFLKKRSIQDMRTLEMKTAQETTAEVSENSPATLSFEDKKKLQRKIQYVEREIEKLESEKESIETTMSHPEFYQSSDAQKVVTKHQDLQKRIDDLYQEWEELASYS